MYIFKVKFLFFLFFAFLNYSDINECENGSNPCHNGGSCNSNDGSFTCSCVDGWAGSLCTQGKNIPYFIFFSFWNVNAFISFPIDITL